MMTKHIPLVLLYLLASACDDTVIPVAGEGTTNQTDGGGTANTGGAGGAATTDLTTAALFSQAYCDLIKPCCEGAGLLTDGKQCKLLLASVANTYRADKGEECIQQLRSAAKSSDFCATFGSDPPACKEAFATTVGTKQPGDDCNDDDECAASNEGKVECAQVTTGGTTIQKCQVQIRAKEGDSPCTATVQLIGNGVIRTSGAGSQTVPPQAYHCYVNDGLTCSAATKTCIKIQPVGGPCESQFNQHACVAEAYCDSAQKLCLAKAGIGSACSTTSKCISNGYCDPSSKLCVSRRPQGATCDKNEQCASDECVNQVCAAPDSGQSLALGLVCGTK